MHDTIAIPIVDEVAPDPVLTFQQTFVWRGLVRDETSASGNVTLAFRSHVPLDPARLEQSLRYVVDRRDALRTAYARGSAGAQRIDLGGADLTLAQVDLGSLEPAHQERRVLELLQRDLLEPLPTDRVALRPTLIRLSESSSVLILTLHHLAVDGTSMRLVVLELFDRYVRGDDPLAADPAPPYALFKSRQDEFLASPRGVRAKAFWREQLHSLRPAPIPSQRPLPESGPTTLDLCHRPVDPVLCRAVEGFCREHAISPFPLFVSIMQRVLARWTGSPDVAVASVLEGRTAVDRGTVGYLANIVVVRTDLSGDPEPHEALRRTASSIRAVQRHGRLPYVWILDNVLAGDHARLPRFHMNYLPLPEEIQGGSVELMHLPRSAIAWNGLDFYDLGVQIMHAPAGMALECRYDPRCLDRDQVDAFLDDYLSAVREALHGDRMINEPWFEAKGRAALRTVAIPELPDGSCEIEAECSAISLGTERLVLNGDVPPAVQAEMACPYMKGNFAFPIQYGYSLVGKVRRGPESLVGKRVHVLHPHQDVCHVRVEDVFVVSESVPARRAILASNLETAVNAVWDAEVQVGDRVVVVGFGTIGALVCHVLRGIAGVDLTVVDVSERKRALANEMGFRALTAEDGPADVAFHTSATSAGLQTALDALGFEGQVVELSWFGTREVTVSLGAGFHARRQRIVCSQVSRIAPRQRPRWDYRRRKELVFRLLTDPRFDACITHESAFSDLPSTYERLDAISREGLYCAVRYPAE